MAAKYLNVYDLGSRQKTAVLQNAYNIVETHELNKIYSLSFTLPADDQKIKYCQPRHYVRWGEDGDLYRIIKPAKSDDAVPTVTFECEHVIATLCDKVMFGSFTYGGFETNTTAVIQWLLSQQAEQNWVLDECDFDLNYEYLWEQENILNALYSIPKEFVAPYMWTFNTTVYPWRLSLKKIDSDIKPEYYLQARRNLLSAGTAENFADICTRIYPLGYGEGINQLTIRDVNGGVPYLQSPPEIIKQYGIIEKVLVDRRFENAELLKAYAQTMLDGLQTPSMTRSFDVVDLYPLTNNAIDEAEVGKIVKMMGDGSIAYVTKTRRQYDKAGDLQIDLSTKATDIVSTIADLADRVRIESVYAQGATQLYQHSKDANATPGKGMVMSLYFPSEMRQINKVLLRMSLKRFRSYSDTTESAGGSTPTTESGGGSTTTTESGGGIGETSTESTSLSGNITSEPSSKETTESGGLGSDVKTSKTPLEFNTGYTELTTDPAGEGKTGDSKISIKSTTETVTVGTSENTVSISGTVNPSGTIKTDASSISIKSATDGTQFRTNAATISFSGNTITVGEGASTGSSSISIKSTTDTTDVGTNEVTLSGGGNTSGPKGDGGYDKNETGGSAPNGYTEYGGGHSHDTYATFYHKHYENGGITGYPLVPTGWGYSESSDVRGTTVSNGDHSHNIQVNDHAHNMTHHHTYTLDKTKHSHTVNTHKHNINITGVGAHTHSLQNSHVHKISFSGVGNHSHSTPEHKHNIDLTNVGSHTHSIFGHNHTFDLTNVGSHSHIVDTHKHNIDITSVGLHNHTLINHTHTIGKHRHFTTVDGHSHSIPKSVFTHTHGMDHTHTVNLSGAGSHSHSFSVPAHKHSVTIPAHTHSVPIPPHRHSIVPGIFESGSASAFDIYVNGKKKVTIAATSYNDDITAWLLNDQNMVPRNQWIDVEIRPNDLAYVVSTVFVQGFVQSRGGGNY